MALASDGRLVGSRRGGVDRSEAQGDKELGSRSQRKQTRLRS